MNGLILMACTIVALFVGYRFYARWLEKTWGATAVDKTTYDVGLNATVYENNLLAKIGRAHV